MSRLALIALLALLLVSQPPAVAAHEGTPYQETITVGPYPVEVWVSSWPVAAQRSVDFTFTPAGGIADKTGTITVIQPNGDPYHRTRPLSRHPRNREVWGIDLIALSAPGDWSIKLTIDGPDGGGEGVFGPFTVTEQPGPSPVLSWSIGVLPPVLFLGTLFVLAWRAMPRARRRQSWTWDQTG